jgi:hypothetical protein
MRLQGQLEVKTHTITELRENLAILEDDLDELEDPAPEDYDLSETEDLSSGIGSLSDTSQGEDDPEIDEELKLDLSSPLNTKL